MIETDQQRRWWFATHPEYSWSRTGQQAGRGSKDGDDDPERLSPEAVDAGVDERLKYEGDDFQIFLLNEIKFWFGTEFQSKSRAEKDALLRDDDEPFGNDGGIQDRAARGEKWAYLDDPHSQVKNDASGPSKDDHKEEEATLWHEVAVGIDNQFQLWESLLGINLGLANPSRKLARAMENAGRPRPQGHDAHHVVPANDKRFPGAVEARKMLEKLGVDLFDQANGVWLPRHRTAIGGTYHPELHTRVYYAEVERLLRRAKTKKRAIQVLEEIGQGLSNRTFPH